MAKHTKAYIALVYICVVWGTTYLAIKVGVKHYPAFLFAGTRQTVAGIILMTAALFLSKEKDLSTRNIVRQMLVGFLMLTTGNGLVSLGMRFIPSGISALICSMMPIFAVLINLTSSKKDHFNATIGFGLLLGTCGVGLIFRHNLAEISKPAYLGGIFLTIVATAGWALGSTINKRHENAVNPFFNSGLQLLFGGMFMLMMSPAIDNYTGLEWNTTAILSLAYLIVFGSALAYAAYMYALSKLPVGIATLYAYINPLIAVVAGFLFLNEELNIYTGLAFATIVLSVYFMNRGYRKQHPRATNTASKLEEAFPEGIPVE
jgi:drug/metabolite transporter (DMT)-like permease